MAIAGRGGVIPTQLKLERAKQDSTQGLTRLVLKSALMVKWSWWHTKSYVPIVAVLLLSLGSLLVLHIHWLYRRLVHMPVREKQVLKDAG